jgi:cytochrome oxidase Cu insertion factor (SCO1/SenC/PrrC family)
VTSRVSGEWRGRPFPSFELESLDGRRFTERHLKGRRAIVFCFASW